jgi:hypothetical protein
VYDNSTFWHRHSKNSLKSSASVRYRSGPQVPVEFILLPVDIHSTATTPHAKQWAAVSLLPAVGRCFLSSDGCCSLGISKLLQ